MKTKRVMIPLGNGMARVVTYMEFFGDWIVLKEDIVELDLRQFHFK